MRSSRLAMALSKNVSQKGGATRNQLNGFNGNARLIHREHDKADAFVFGCGGVSKHWQTSS